MLVPHIRSAVPTLLNTLGCHTCNRYLAARCTGAAGEVAVVSERRRSSLARSGVQPASLVQSPLFATPLGRTTMLRAGRSKKAAELGPTWQSKVGCLLSPTCCLRLLFGRGLAYGSSEINGEMELTANMVDKFAYSHQYSKSCLQTF